MNGSTEKPHERELGAALGGPFLRQSLERLRALFYYDLRAGITQNSLILLSGNVAGMALSLVSSALLARGLGPEGLSVFAVLGTLSSISLTIADLGLSSSAIRQIAGELAHSSESARRIASTYARLKVLAGFIACAVLLILAAPFARALNLPANSGRLLIAVASLMLFVSIVHGATGTILQALRRFRVLAGAQLVNASLTVLFVGAFYVFDRLTIWSALLIVGAVSTLAAASLEFLWLPPDWRKAVLSKGRYLTFEGRRLFHFSKWLWVSASLSVISSQLDLLLLNFWAAPQAVGVYALALNLSFKAHIVNKALYTVLLPSVSALNAKGTYRTYVRHSLVRSLLLGLLVIALLPFARPFILAVYGTAYAPSVNVFYLLMAFVIFDLFSMPVLLLAFPMNMPRLIAASDAMRVVTLVVAGVLLIPLWGMFGAALAKLASIVAGSLVTGSAIAIRLGKGPVSPVR